MTKRKQCAALALALTLTISMFGCEKDKETTQSSAVSQIKTSDSAQPLFGITIARPGWLNPFYTYGAIALAAPAWAAGTACGIIAGNLLPLRAVSALSVALYGMFLAIIIPPARKSKVVAALVAISFALSFVCTYLPGISALSDGTRTILLTVAISCAAAILFPVKQEEGNQ